MKRPYIIIAATAIALLFVAIPSTLYIVLIQHEYPIQDHTECIYIDADDNVDSVKVKSCIGWRFDVYARLLNYTPKTGRYMPQPGETRLSFYKKLRNKVQEPLNLTLPNVRTMDQMASRLSTRLMADSAQWAALFQDTAYIRELGYTEATLPALFIPNTYQVYWDVQPKDFMQRMKRENRVFWNQEREQKALQIGLSHEEIYTLASIVDEETACNEEKSMIAGMYINRLHKGMPLQADPTVKFAMRDFGLRRIYHTHLKTESPYNTYLYKGLPPGPIRTASIHAIDAVLSYTSHPYLYMCAKEDFSGRHNFAVTYSEHLSNARRYARALNQRNIK